MTSAVNSSRKDASSLGSRNQSHLDATSLSKSPRGQNMNAFGNSGLTSPGLSGGGGLSTSMDLSLGMTAGDTQGKDGVRRNLVTEKKETSQSAFRRFAGSFSKKSDL
eukprot:TRINITY_DN11490_c0_g1::TRINITY_DN11490_c0_g1_i1::g.10882::m.10882 TRINITY_DN11490_c0_g1::TRINITY_DN11490_c0_g1_i1::g.10882  ORF type:complete len:121 (-),score=9.21 TRINITY_DN11490_c0_g1_i1:83-403(-)